MLCLIQPPAKTAKLFQDTSHAQKMRNEPNLKNTKMNLNLFKTTNYGNFRPFGHRKNEPKTNPIYADSNPICEKNTKIYAISKYNFSQLFTTALRRFMRRWDFSTKKVQLFTTLRPKKCETNPILKTLK